LFDCSEAARLRVDWHESKEIEFKVVYDNAAEVVRKLFSDEPVAAEKLLDSIDVDPDKKAYS
jgi:hypothetical protein